MIDVHDSSAPDLLEVKVTGKLTSADFDHLEPVLEKHVAESVHPKLLMIMEQFSGWSSPEVFWQDLKLDTAYIGKFDRIALVGDANWEEWGTNLINPVTPADLKFFKPEETQHALRWLQQ